MNVLAELTAMKKITALLEKIDQPGRQRIVDYLTSWMFEKKYRVEKDEPQQPPVVEVIE